MDAGSHDPGASAPPELLPQHTIFLSHSGQEKAFVQELNQSLLLVDHSPFFDQNEDSLPKGERFPDLIFKAAEQCRVAVIVLSRGYLTSKWPMLELVAFHKSMKDGNPIKILPVFYKLKPDQIEKSEWMEKWVDLFKQDKELVEKCKDAVHALKVINGLIFQGNDHVKYKKDVVRKICKLWPPPKPFDTSDMQGCDRLCKHVSELFEEHNGIHYLGILGTRGSGKSEQCQAMCNYYSEEYAGKFCILDLEDDKTTHNRAAKKLREERLKIAIEKIVGSNQIMSYINLEEAQLRKYLKDRVHNQRVFLVVENVSHSSIEEAEFYVKAGYAHGSRVLVTSRNRSFLEEVFVFGGRQYSDFCHPVPLLNNKEAAQLVLAGAAPGTFLTDLNDNEKKSISELCADFSIIEGYYPSSLIALGRYLHRRPLSDVLAFVTKNGSGPIWNSFQESEEAGVMYSQILPEYINLSHTAKLIFLDLALCYESKLSSASWQWNECNNLTDASVYISLLHDESLMHAQTEVKKLQEKNFLKESRTELAVPHFYYLFARWLFDAGDVDREEKKWLKTFFVCRQERDDRGYPLYMTWPADVSVETVTRVILIQPYIHSYKIDEVMRKLQQFTNLVYLELVQVKDLKKLDLRGLSSLRVMKVELCKDLKEIDCNCGSLMRRHRCYQKEPMSSNFDNFSAVIPSTTSLQQLIMGLDDLGKSSRCLKNLRSVQLIDLPSLKVVSFALHCSNLESLLIYDCPKVVETLYQFPRDTLKRLVSPRVGISRSNSAKEDLRELVSDARTRQISKEYLIHDARRISTKSAVTRVFAASYRDVMAHAVRRFDYSGPLTEPEELAEMESSIEITRANSISLGLHKQLTTLDLTGSKITEVEGLRELENLEALCLYCCTELLTLPNLGAFTQLKRLCIAHCHKLAIQNLPRNVEDFHSFGDKCNVGEHECLDPGEGNCRRCMERDESDHGSREGRTY